MPVHKRRTIGFLSGRCFTWPFHLLNVPLDVDNKWRVKCGPLESPGRISEFCFKCNVNDPVIIVVPVVSPSAAESPLRLNDFGDDVAICQGRSWPSFMYPGFHVVGPDNVCRVALGYILSRDNLYLGVHIYNGSAGPVNLHGWFVFEEVLA